MPKKVRTTRETGRRAGTRRQPATSARPAARPAARAPRSVKPSTADPGDAANPSAVHVRIGPGPSGIVARVPATDLLETLAAKWMYIVRNRSRWASDLDLRDEIAEAVARDLERLGITESALRAVNSSPLRHVELEFIDSHGNGREQTSHEQAAAAFPWEFAISNATKHFGRSQSILITRLLARDAPRPGGQPSELLFVQSAPGRLNGYYSFESERARLEAATQRWTGGVPTTDAPTRRRGWRISDTETLERLARRIERSHPQIVHVSAIDNHQAAQIIEGFYDEAVAVATMPQGPTDGMVVRGIEAAEVPVDYTDLARHIVPDGNKADKPWLVTSNFYYSGARFAKECVRRGAYAALGFQDEVDDEVAEHFFQVLYQAWSKVGTENLPRAFGLAWTILQRQGHHLFGTGIILWLTRSACDGSLPIFRSLEDDHQEVEPPRLPTPEERSLARSTPIQDVLQVELEVPQQVNYSLLHNARPFLEKLTLSKLVEHALDEVSVFVDLNVGDGSLPFRYTELLLQESRRTLLDQVRVPLTAPLLRSLRERVQSTLYVKVTWDGRTAHESTHSVTLLPVDEWFDDTKENPWLPSFVLPRDPAVAGIISVARRHLVTLLDDPTAGFDGYQSLDNTLDDPSEFVDLQVQAIWAALTMDYKLLYINPPPAYSSRNQRLRTPSEVVASNSGTCVDLALLLAACLEYVDIHPVIVLLSGHAFVGYWRSDEGHEDFRRVSRVPSSLGIDLGPLTKASTISLVDPYGWRLGPQQYAEIRQCLRGERLRFLEATGLCFGFSFAEALEEGAGNLRSPEDFDSLLDLRLARLADPPVTPIPVLSHHEGGGPR